MSEDGSSNRETWHVVCMGGRLVSADRRVPVEELSQGQDVEGFLGDEERWRWIR